MIAGRPPRAYASGLRRLFTERRGVAAVEFAVVAPLFLLASMGVFDLSYQYYVKATLAGIMEEAGRAATLQDLRARQKSVPWLYARPVSTLDLHLDFLSPYAYLAWKRARQVLPGVAIVRIRCARTVGRAWRRRDRVPGAVRQPASSAS